MSEFGVSFTCYTENKAIEYSLGKLFSIYPECPVHLVSDGGSDFSYLEKKYPTLKTELREDRRGWFNRQGIAEHLKHNVAPYGTPGIDPSEKEYFELLYNMGMSWMDRNKAAVDYAQKPYMLMMETDVLVRGKLTMPKNHKLICSIVNDCRTWVEWYTDPNWNNVLSKVPGSKPVDCYGWPYIYESNAFNEVYEFIKTNDNIFRELVASHFNFGGAGDVTIPVCFALLGYEQGPNPDVAECLRYPGWRESSHPLLHQFRDHYPTEEDKYDGRHSEKW